VLIKCIALAGCLLATTGVQAQDAISFAKDIRPIVEASCWKYHSATVQLSKPNLRTRESAIAGGVHGPAVSPGSPGASRLYRMVAGAEKPSMPLTANSQPLRSAPSSSGSNREHSGILLQQ
jgi:hypothetical protein